MGGAAWRGTRLSSVRISPPPRLTKPTTLSDFQYFRVNCSKCCMQTPGPPGSLNSLLKIQLGSEVGTGTGIYLNKKEQHESVYASQTFMGAL